MPILYESSIVYQIYISCMFENSSKISTVYAPKTKYSWLNTYKYIFDHCEISTELTIHDQYFVFRKEKQYQ